MKEATLVISPGICVWEYAIEIAPLCERVSRVRYNWNVRKHRALLFPVIFHDRARIRVTSSPDDTMTQLHEEDDDQRQFARQHPAKCLRYPAGIASVNDEHDGERHLAVSSHPLGIPITGTLPPPLPFCNHRWKEERPSTLSTHFPPVRRYPWPYGNTAFTCIPIRNMFYANTQLSRRQDKFHIPRIHAKSSTSRERGVNPYSVQRKKTEEDSWKTHPILIILRTPFLECTGNKMN